jgi:hypothetical protein
VRRKRRQRIGLKLLKGLQHRTDERNDRYYQRDENRVVKRMKNRQFLSNFEDFSDSEGYVSEEDSEDSADPETSSAYSGEVNDVMETSPKPVGAARKQRRQQSSLGGELHLGKRTKMNESKQSHPIQHLRVRYSTTIQTEAKEGIIATRFELATFATL